jgi:glycosyltransferase involved in cell wall biosynthesis
LIECTRIIKRKIIPPHQATIVSGNRQRSPFFERLICNSDAYFSSYYAMIQEIDVNPSLRKLQVIHDLTPILFPNLFPKNNCFLEDISWHDIEADVRILTDSVCTKLDLLNHFSYITENQITVIPLGAGEHFRPCTDKVKIESVLKKYGLSENTIYILSVATLEIRKNFDHVIRSFSVFIEKYGEQFPDLKLVLTGKKGWLDRKIYAAYNKLKQKVKKKINFTGHVDDIDLPFLYNGASCFCFMSLYEGFGLPPLEAMQCGVPVITSNTSSLPEVVGDAGIMLDPHDVDGLVNAFYRVLTDENLRNQMIAKGLEQTKKFNWDRCVDLIIEKIND